jgi:hypothetical protein
MVNFYRCFLPNCAQVLKPLTDLLKGGGGPKLCNGPLPLRMYEDSPGFPISRYFECLSIWIYDIFFIYIRVPYFNIPFVFLDTWRTLFTIFKISHYVFIEILKFEVNITSPY